MPLTRYARTEESPYLRRALDHADPHRHAAAVHNRVYHLVHYGDPVAEYWSLIDGAVLWDMAHERQVEISGPDAAAFTQMLVPRDLSSHEVGQCKYAFLTGPDGGIIADPVILRLADDRYWLGAADADVHLWCLGLAVGSGLDVTVSVPDVAPVQLQGPRADAVMVDLFGEEILGLGYYRLCRRRLGELDLVVSRSGWSGDTGYEIYVGDARADDNARAERWWDMVMRAGERHDLTPAGPSHIRRIEAGMPALGYDIDESTNPFEVAPDWGWMVDLDQPDDFVGKQALARIRSSGPRRRLVGVEIDGPDLGTSTDGLLPLALPVRRDGREVGTLTSACRSPRLGRNIGFALVEIHAVDIHMVEADAVAGDAFEVLHPVHGCLLAHRVPTPFLP